MNAYPRVAFLPDTFFEVNGVAHTARHLESFARRRQIPFLSVHCGPKTEKIDDGVVSILQLARGPTRLGLDANLDYDLLLWRYSRRVAQEARDFGADLIHITGPGDLGSVGLYVSWLLNLPLAISWHTSLHEYAGTRLQRLLRFAGPGLSNFARMIAEKGSLEILRQFYRCASVTMAPNQELTQLTHSLTGKPCHLMSRGVDTHLFNPARRHRVNNAFQLGYVGRLTPEKNVRFLASLAAGLQALGRADFEFIIIGEGSEEPWLRAHLPNATFTGVLRGDSLAHAYAAFDLFVFPSHTDTFGNVVLEALASGVPAVVTNHGGPKFLVESGVTGYVASNEADFIACVDKILTNSPLHTRMRHASVAYAQQQSWDGVFESVFRTYAEAIQPNASAFQRRPAPLLSSRVHGRSSP